MAVLFKYNINIILIFFLMSNFSFSLTSSLTNGSMNLSWNSEEGNTYRLVNSTNLIDDLFSTTIANDVNATPPTNQLSVTMNNDVGFYKIEPQLILEDDFDIIQTWSQETNYARPVKVAIPNGSGPFPVVIHLHGNGGSGNVGAIGYLDDVIRVAPDGYRNSWNIGREQSKAPDVDFIRKIIEHLNLHSNVDGSRITVIGSSNGGALVNLLMIELEDNTFQQGIGLVSNMITNMFDGTNFRYDSNSEMMQYDEVIMPVTGRRMLTICGELDPVVPYEGGTGVLQNQFYAAQESVFIWARYMGYDGEQIPDDEGVPYINYNDLVEYSYLNGDIMHYKHLGKEHNAGGGIHVRDVIRDWIGY